MTVPSIDCLIASNMFLQYERWTVRSLIWAANVINWPNGEAGQRQTAFPGKPTLVVLEGFTWGKLLFETFLFTLLQSPPACCDCSMLAVWCSDSHDFPSPSPRRAPFCGGKGWFNSSQLRALQRCWQACLPEYAMHTSVHVCVCARVHMRACGWSAMRKIKAHDTGTPAVMSDDASPASDFCKNVFFFFFFYKCLT